MSNTHIKNGFHHRLEMFIKQNYESRRDFSQALKMSESTINQMFSARKTKPTYDFFEAFLHVHKPEDLSYLITGVYDWAAREPDSNYAKTINPYDMLNTALDRIIEDKLSSVVVTKK